MVATSDPDPVPRTARLQLHGAPVETSECLKGYGEMAEWFKAHAWKACIRGIPYRGFESLSLRHSKISAFRKVLRTYGVIASPPLNHSEPKQNLFNMLF